MGHSGLPATRPNAPLYARVATRVPDIARCTVARCAAEVPFYALLPAEQLDGELTDLVVMHLQLFLRVLREGRLPTEVELTEPVSAAARRAGEWAPLTAVLTAYRIGGRIGWRELVRLAAPEDTRDLTTAGAYLLEYLQMITHAIAAVYLEEEQTALGERRETRRALMDALLAGDPAEELAERAGMPLRSGYLVLQLHLPEPVPESGAAGGVAARGRVHRVREELDGFARTPVLSKLNGHGGVALLPVDRGRTDTGDGGSSGDAGGGGELTGLFDRIAGVCGAPIVVGIAEAAGPGQIPAAADEAREVALIASRLGRPPGLYRLDDVLLEFQLTRPGPARDRLARRLDVLTEHTALLETLRTYLRLGNNRRQAAQALHVHPNTLDYRLRRVAAFTGLDPLAPADARLLSAALTARALLR